MDAFMKLPNGQEDSDAEADDVFVYEGSQARDVPDPVTESAVHPRGSEVDPEGQRTEAQMRDFLEEMEQRQHGPGASQTRDVPNRDSDGEPEAEKAEAQMRNFLEEMEHRQHGPGASGPTPSHVSKHK